MIEIQHQRYVSVVTRRAELEFMLPQPRHNGIDPGIFEPMALALPNKL